VAISQNEHGTVEEPTPESGVNKPPKRDRNEEEKMYTGEVYEKENEATRDLGGCLCQKGSPSSRARGGKTAAEKRWPGRQRESKARPQLRLTKSDGAALEVKLLKKGKDVGAKSRDYVERKNRMPGEKKKRGRAGVVRKGVLREWHEAEMHDTQQKLKGKRYETRYAYGDQVQK